MTSLKFIVLAIAVLMYLLVIIFQNKKVWFTTAAAVLVIILGMIFPDSAVNAGSFIPFCGTYVHMQLRILFFR